jgi:hypothetical protein
MFPVKSWGKIFDTHTIQKAATASISVFQAFKQAIFRVLP